MENFSQTKWLAMFWCHYYSTFLENTLKYTGCLALFNVFENAEELTTPRSERKFKKIRESMSQDPNSSSNSALLFISFCVA